MVAKGLDGVVVDETAVCLADHATDRLYVGGASSQAVPGSAT